MQRHVAECPPCAAHDARIRRSLLLARNLPSIEPSANFAPRLEARLRLCREHPVPPPYANFRTVASVGAVASLLMLGYVASALHLAWEPAQDLVLPPVVAIAEPPVPEGLPDDQSAIRPGLSRGPSSLSQRPTHQGVSSPSLSDQPEIVRGAPPAPAIVASVSAAIPLWPAARFAEDVPLHFARYRESGGTDENMGDRIRESIRDRVRETVRESATSRSPVR